MATAAPGKIVTPGATAGSSEEKAARRATRWKALFTTVALVVAGLGIGWLVGLSVSPVVSIVITSVTASAAAVVAAMSGLDGEARASALRASPLPLALLIVGMVGGSSLGLMARSQSWLSSDLSGEVRQWTDLGMDQKEVVNKLFAVHYGEPSAPSEAGSKDSALFSAEDRGFCQALESLPPAELLASMKNPDSTPSILTTVAKYVDDPAVFRKVFVELCGSAYF